MRRENQQAVDKFFFARLTDKMQLCDRRCIPVCTAFLSEHERFEAERFLRSVSCENSAAFGGVPDAERVKLCFLPDYIGKDDVNAEIAAIAFLRISLSAFDASAPLTHRDYLGALLNLGIERDALGDLYVCDGFADLVLTQEMVSFVCEHLQTVGRYHVKCEEISAEQVQAHPPVLEQRSDTVASLRIDAVLASGYCISREAAADAVRSGLVSVNGGCVLKPDATVHDSDRIVVRGKGKCRLQVGEGLTKKGRIRITFLFYR